MNWAYVAGFFDGEGNIRIEGSNGRLNPQVSIHQSATRGLELLREMQEFFLEHGIKGNINTWGKETPSGHRMYRLYVYNRAGVIGFIHYTMPYLHIKKTEAQDVLRTLKLFPPCIGGRKFQRHPVVPKTICERGHALTDDNSYISYDWLNRERRTCKTCAKRRASDRYASLKEKFAKNCKTDPKVARWL